MLFVLYQTKYALYILFSIVSFFFFESMGVNVIRQGIALSLMTLAIQRYIANDKKQFIIFSLVSISFHITAVFILLLFFIQKKISQRCSLLILAAATTISLIGENLLLVVKDLPYLESFYTSRIASYAESTTEIYKIGFRLDFFLFNISFMILFFWIQSKFRLKLSAVYGQLLKLYILLTAVFILSFHGSYSDRVGLLSWILMPFLLSPLVYEHKAKVLFVIINVVLFIIFI